MSLHEGLRVGASNPIYYGLDSGDIYALEALSLPIYLLLVFSCCFWRVAETVHKYLHSVLFI